MRNLLFIFGLLSLHIQASELSLRSVKQPLYLHGGGESPGISVTDVPFVSYYADPEWRFSAIAEPFIPANDSGWKTPHNVNLASLYGISVGGTYMKGSRDMLVRIDISKALVPEGYPFTIEQVTQAVETCVRLMYPPKPRTEGKLEIEIVRSED